VNRPLIVGIAGAIIVLVAIVLTFFIEREPDNTALSPPQSKNTAVPQPRDALEPKWPVRTAISERAALDAREKVALNPEAVSPSMPSENLSKAAAKASAVVEKPSFDIVRVSPRGDTVIAGRAQPNAEITVMKGGETIGRVQADKRGEWVLIPETSIQSGTHILTIASRRADGTEVTSDQSVVIVVPEGKTDIADMKTETPGGVVAVVVPKENNTPPLVLQTPGGVGEAELSLNVIDYGSSGTNLWLSGRAPDGSEVRVYLDDKFVGRSIAEDDGVWRVNPRAQILPGLYRMRVDRVDNAGKVIGRVELPFSREIPEQNLAEGAMLLVQPGNSLWRLARRSYGQGLRYTEIYQANKDQIRDPDLIYPGQLLVLPKNN
jgi:hypothetical protein